MNIQETMDRLGLNWSVRKEQIVTVSGIPVEGAYAIVREDNNTAFHKPMMESYQPYQNKELFELLDKVSGSTGLSVATGGMFKNGARVFVQLKSEDLILAGDKIEGYLTGINSYDGSTSLAFGPSNITISCMNSFFAAFKEMNTKIRHTKNMSVKVDEVVRYLMQVKNEEQKMFANIKTLSEIRMTDNNVDAVLRKLFDLDRNVDLKDEEAISTRKRNQMVQFGVDLQGELNQKGDNLWGLFSGVTKYTTHSLTNSLESKMNGVIGKKEQAIFQDLVELI
jgi:phage/plasmid-like protein (TIGR03299 family)